MNKCARKMTDAEGALFNRFLDEPFAGSEAVAEQLHNSLVVPIDNNGSLDFVVRGGSKAEVHNSVPVEAEAEDLDGITIHMLLHVIDGVVRGLEVYKEDFSRVKNTPSPLELRIFSPP